MNSMILGLYGIYLMLVAWNGNGPNLADMITAEKSFVPWIVALLVLGLLSSYSGTHDFVAPFLLLAIFATVTTRFNHVREQVGESYRFLTT